VCQRTENTVPALLNEVFWSQKRQEMAARLTTVSKRRIQHHATVNKQGGSNHIIRIIRGQPERRLCVIIGLANSIAGNQSAQFGAAIAWQVAQVTDDSRALPYKRTLIGVKNRFKHRGEDYERKRSYD